jgi:hypothetical protein
MYILVIGKGKHPTVGNSNSTPLQPGQKLRTYTLMDEWDDAGQFKVHPSCQKWKILSCDGNLNLVVPHPAGSINLAFKRLYTKGYRSSLFLNI